MTQKKGAKQQLYLARRAQRWRKVICLRISLIALAASYRDKSKHCVAAQGRCVVCAFVWVWGWKPAMALWKVSFHRVTFYNINRHIRGDKTPIYHSSTQIQQNQAKSIGIPHYYTLLLFGTQHTIKITVDVGSYIWVDVCTLIHTNALSRGYRCNAVLRE